MRLSKLFIMFSLIIGVLAKPVPIWGNDQWLSEKIQCIYVVRPMRNSWLPWGGLTAKRFNISPRSLFHSNNHIKDWDHLQRGTVLFIPYGNATSYWDQWEQRTRPNYRIMIHKMVEMVKQHPTIDSTAYIARITKSPSAGLEITQKPKVPKPFIAPTTQRMIVKESIDWVMVGLCMLFGTVLGSTVSWVASRLHYEKKLREETSLKKRHAHQLSELRYKTDDPQRLIFDYLCHNLNLPVLSVDLKRWLGVDRITARVDRPLTREQKRTIEFDPQFNTIVQKYIGPVIFQIEEDDFGLNSSHVPPNPN